MGNERLQHKRTKLEGINWGRKTKPRAKEDVIRTKDTTASLIRS